MTQITERGLLVINGLTERSRFPNERAETKVVPEVVPGPSYRVQITERGLIVINGLTERGRFPKERAELVYPPTVDGGPTTLSGSSDTQSVANGLLKGMLVAMSGTSDTASTAIFRSLSAVAKKGFARSQKDAFASGRTATVSTVEGATIDWQLNIPSSFGNIIAGPVIDADGVIYVCQDDHFYKVSPQGQIIWQRTGGFEGPPTIGDDGIIYVANEPNDIFIDIEGGVTAFSPQGDILWQYKAGSFADSVSNPNIYNGTIYMLIQEEVGFVQYALHAVNPDGTLRWKFRGGDQPYTSQEGVAIAKDGTIYYTTLTILYALNRDGAVKWQFGIANTSTEQFDNCACVAPDGTIYVGSTRGVYAVNPDGSQKWFHSVDPNGNLTLGIPAVGSDGSYYCSALTASVFAVTSNGTRKWTLNLGAEGDMDQYYTRITLGGDDTLYMFTKAVSAVVRALDPVTGATIWIYDFVAGGGAGLAISDDGTLYATTAEVLHRFGNKIVCRAVNLFGATTGTLITMLK